MRRIQWCQQPGTLPAFSTIVTAHFSHLCCFCSLMVNFSFRRGVLGRESWCWSELQLPAKAHCELPTLRVLPVSPHSPATWFYDLRDFPVLTGGLANCPTAPSLPGRGGGWDLIQNQQKSVDRISLTDTGFKSDSINREICIKCDQLKQLLSL